MKDHHTLQSAPLKRRFFTPGTYLLLVLMGVGTTFGIGRLLTGLDTVTNLSDSFPWGIWIAIDVAVGVALAAGGFTTAAFADIFGGKKYHALLRPAVLTAWLGYIMVAFGLMFDLGRYWNIYQPLFNWQGNSVMFELAMCVMTYLIVLTFELAPSILEGFKIRIEHNEWGAKILKKVEKPIILIHSWLKVILPIFIIAGVVLSCMHQSSLGTLMVIAPTKLSPFWHTAWLPLLFLLSAIMVGFPMVVIESVSSSKGLKREAEMEVLEPLSSKVPWFIAVYAVFKFGDLIARWGQLDFTHHPGCTISLTIELIMGVAVPFVLLCFRAVRRSKGWLLTSSFLVVFGVILNRLNVFLVGYHPAFAEETYAPAIGEVALTLGLVAFLIFLYKFFVNYFPILPVLSQSEEPEEQVDSTDEGREVKPAVAWVFRGSAVLFLLAFVMLYSVVHKEAIVHAELTYGEVLAPQTGPPPQAEKQAATHQFRPEKYRNFYVINSPLLNTRADYYEPVVFSHRSHDVDTGSDCSVCHHRMSDDESDRVGMDLKTMHDEIEVRIGGACAACHEDMGEKEMQKCSACHIASNEEDNPSRIGLKGAYHRQCIGCHVEQPASANAPTDCISCHHPITPDHSKLVTVTEKDTPQHVTAHCLDCHDRVGGDVLKSAHWNWKGLTPFISGHEHENIGLSEMIDNYTITMLPNLVETWSFHIGYSPNGGRFDPANTRNIDCLVCHDTTGNYRKDEKRNGLPAENIDLVEIAQKVGRPSRANCGLCHFNVGGGPNVKHGDLEPSFDSPSADMDVHMGMVDMRCQDCHKTEAHRIAGMSFAAPVTEGRVTCEKCHGDHPHGITGYLSRHLDDHVRAISCEACHIPFFAVQTPTLLSTDYSAAGQDKPGALDDHGMPMYDRKRGGLTWGKRVVPEYRWFDGNRKSYVLGDTIDPSSEVELNAPLGAKHIPESRIFPFKVHTAVQPYDKEKEALVAVKFKDGYWQHFDWNRAIKEGMDLVGQEYSGQYGFVKTRMYTSIHHGVVPATEALGCSDCHRVEAITCKRCHKSAEGMDQPSHTRKVYPGVPRRFDFKSLGYEDDPAIMGGRFFHRLGRGRPPG
jgi:octaheme c-type cytochrome (tetrathionate reductase family)